MACGGAHFCLGASKISSRESYDLMFFGVALAALRSLSNIEKANATHTHTNALPHVQAYKHILLICIVPPQIAVRMRFL